VPAHVSKVLVRRTLIGSSSPILVLLSLSGLAILALVFLAAIWAGSESDSAALDRQRHLVNVRIQDQVQRVSQEIQLMGAGYASLLRVDPQATKTSQASEDRNTTASAATFGEIMTTIFGYDAAFLVTTTGQLALQADAETARRFKWVRPLLEPLFRELQATSGATGHLSASATEPSRVELMRLEGRPSVAGAVMVPGASRNPAQQQDQLYYLIVFRFLDGAALDKMSREQGLASARYARTADQEQNEVAHQMEATATGEPIGFIIWEPDLPGSRVIGRLIPVLSLAALVIAALFFALMARLRGSLRQLNESVQHAQHLSDHDVLTGLSNRALFGSRLEERLATISQGSRRAAIALIDLDKFKEVNDTYGHAAGDELLCEAVARMSALIGESNTLARVGGDEFALLIADLDEGEESYQTICNNIVSEMSQRFRLQVANASVRIGCSIGVTIASEPDLHPSEILRRADVALYEAKTRGRGQVVGYQSSLDHRIEAREKLKDDLRLVLDDHLSEATAANPLNSSAAGHLEIYYQGIHRADQQAQLCGAEALVRWHHPSLGLLSPNKFVPVAEEAGLIDRLGEWVLSHAAHAAASWPSSMSLAVNVSPSQIRRRGFDRHVLSILSRAGLPPDRLELELTEAALFNLDEEVHATLGRVRAKGTKVALDDFGTGFSSLSHVIQLNIDRVKIDQSFVKLLGTKAEGAAIISSIIGLSRVLGKATTAEGVETQGQRDFLVAAGCNELQGFMLSRPMPLPDFLEFMDRSARCEYPHQEASDLGLSEARSTLEGI